MTNEEWLNKKLGKTYDSIDAGEKVDYLLDQVDWMQKFWVESWEQPAGCTTVRYYPENGYDFQTTGSCLLEAIENAQKEQENV